MFRKLSRMIRQRMSVQPVGKDEHALSEIFWDQAHPSAPASFGKSLTRKEDGKVAVLGLPKSGTTWLQLLVADSLDLSITHPLDARAEDGAPRVIKLHNDYASISRKKDLLSGVYIIRDIRDVIVSYYHYTQSDFYTKVDPSAIFKDIASFYYEYFLSVVVPSYQWVDHPETFVSKGIPMIRYEILYDDPFKELSRLFRRWGIECSGDSIRDAIKKNRIDNLKATGLCIPGLGEIGKDFFRVGGYGNFRNELPGKVLADIDNRFGAFLARWGY